MKRTFFAIIVAISASACSNGEQAAMSAWGKPHHVKQFSGGVLVGEWDSTGKINETQSDGYYFEDAKTHKLVSISGTVQITLP
jgi:hypothetical protein